MSKLYKFTKSQIDTIISADNIKKIGLSLITQPDSVFPKSLVEKFTIIPIEYLNEKNNYIEIHFPFSAKYYNWHDIDNAVLYRKGKGKKSKYFLWNNDSSIRLTKK